VGRKVGCHRGGVDFVRLGSVEGRSEATKAIVVRNNRRTKSPPCRKERDKDGAAAVEIHFERVGQPPLKTSLSFSGRSKNKLHCSVGVISLPKTFLKRLMISAGDIASL
jgi:hypothetical protein